MDERRNVVGRNERRTGIGGTSGLLEEPFNFDDTLSIVEVCELTEYVSREIDVG
jgi:hypothetical protein